MGPNKQNLGGAIGMHATWSGYLRCSVLSILLSLPLGQPAHAQTPLPADLISPNVPHEVATGASASVTELAIFAWQEFTALNWPAVDPATTGQRGRPDTNSNFLTIMPDQTGSYPLLVWQTYRHKNELFPADGNTDPSFDSTAPSYKYKGPPIQPGQPGYTNTLFNNLDESSEIGLCNMFAHDSTRILYEAKVNRAVFNYANTNKLTQCDDKNDCPILKAALLKTAGNLAENGAICSVDPSIVSLPCGDAATTGDAGEGAIEIKAAWRQLTTDESKSGRFYMRKVLYYTGPQYVGQQYQNAVYGLVALHIIHKTKAFPTFVFATWEQVDNYDDKDNQNTENLKFVNTGTDLPNIAVNRAHPIHSQIGPVNDAVHAAFTSKDPSTVWQYYKLIGVQGTPVNGPPPAGASADQISYYYLANIVVETNQTLQNFFGAAPDGVVVPFNNVYLSGASGSPFQMGGCQGCHGTQGQSIGGDMSRLIGAAPSNSTHPPESFDAGQAASIKSYVERSANAAGYR
jgi:hypothetical protein